MFYPMEKTIRRLRNSVVLNNNINFSLHGKNTVEHRINFGVITQTFAAAKKRNGNFFSSKKFCRHIFAVWSARAGMKFAVDF